MTVELADYHERMGDRARAALYRALTAGKRVTSPQESSPPKPDLRRATYDLLPRLRESSDAEKLALMRRGLISLPVLPKTLLQVIDEDPEYFLEGVVGYVGSRPQLRDFVPPAVSIAVNPLDLGLRGSSPRSQASQLAMINEYSIAEIEPIFPGARAIMLPTSAYVQLDIAYRQQTGRPLLRDCFARALDQTSGSDVAYVGRSRSGDRLSVGGLLAVGENAYVRAVSGVVFVGE